MGNNITDIVFDLGGVLVDWDPMYLYRKVFGSKEEARVFLDHICTFDWNAAQDGGRTIKEANDYLIGKSPEFEKEIKMFYERWEEMFSGEITGTVEILKKLEKQNTRGLYALTNWSAETFPRARQLFPFFSIFQGIVVSGDEKLMKPGPEIYHILIDRYQLTPEQTVYIDDSFPNVVTADQLGFHAHHFEGPEKLAEFLETKGIKF